MDNALITPDTANTLIQSGHWQWAVVLLVMQFLIIGIAIPVVKFFISYHIKLQEEKDDLKTELRKEKRDAEITAIKQQEKDEHNKIYREIDAIKTMQQQEITEIKVTMENLAKTIERYFQKLDKVYDHLFMKKE